QVRLFGNAACGPPWIFQPRCRPSKMGSGSWLIETDSNLAWAGVAEQRPGLRIGIVRGVGQVAQRVIALLAQRETRCAQALQCLLKRRDICIRPILVQPRQCESAKGVLEALQMVCE